VIENFGWSNGAPGSHRATLGPGTNAISLRIVVLPLWMADVDLRSIELLVTVLVVCMRPKFAQAKRREQCLTAWKVRGLTGPRAAQSVMASLGSSGIIRGERRFAPRSASIASERAVKVTAIGWAGSKSPWRRPRTARGRHDLTNLTTRQGISEDSADFAPHRPDHDGPGDCGSAQGACRRLWAASREGLTRWCNQGIG